MPNQEKPDEIISQPNQEQEREEEFKFIYRGIWADRLSPGQKLPVGGSLFDKNLSTKLELDFDYFEDDLENFTEENEEQRLNILSESCKNRRFFNFNIR